MVNKAGTLTMELDKRLEDLFDEATLLEPEEPVPSLAQSRKTEPAERKSSPSFTEGNPPGGENLRNLNTLLLSMDWEIDDSIMDQYLTEIHRLQNQWKKDKITLRFFRTLEALGTYLKQKKVHAHQETLRVLQEVQTNLGILMDMGDGFSEDQKKAYFQKTYTRFQEFRKKTIKKAMDLGDTQARDGSELSSLIRNIVYEELEKFRQRLLQDLRQ